MFSVLSRKIIVPSLLSNVILSPEVINIDKEQSLKVSKEGFIRIANLCYCVVAVASKYAYYYQFKKGKVDIEYNKLGQELEKLQDEERKVLLNHPVELTAEAMASLKALKKDMDVLSQHLSSTKNKVLSDLHTESAVRLRNLCMKNKGVYIKLGQHLSQLDYIFPEEYCSAFRDLLDQNPRSSYDQVCQVFLEEFGCKPEQLFQSFDITPIASASLAQVHTAVGFDGKKYAVKVQHHGLRGAAMDDLHAITSAVTFVSKLFKGFNYDWLVREMNYNLPIELDFRNEKDNMVRCSELLKDFIEAGDVAVPIPVKELSRSRILTMSFEEGVSLGKTGVILADKRRARVDEAAEEGGSASSYEKDLVSRLDPSDVAYIISKIFSELIYRHGFVHCDPHEANLHIRENPKKLSKPQLILLDHGLYRQLDDRFRRSYTRLWSKLIATDVDGIRKYCGEIGIEKKEMVGLFSSLITMKSWNDIVSGNIDKKRTVRPKVNAEILRRYAMKYRGVISDLLNDLPSDMLLLLKTNDCLRHIDRLLGVPINTVAVIAETTASVIISEDYNEARSASDLYNVLYDYTFGYSRSVGLVIASNALAVYTSAIDGYNWLVSFIS